MSPYLVAALTSWASAHGAPNRPKPAMAAAKGRSLTGDMMMCLLRLDFPLLQVAGVSSPPVTARRDARAPLPWCQAVAGIGSTYSRQRSDRSDRLGPETGIRANRTWTAFFALCGRVASLGVGISRAWENAAISASCRTPSQARAARQFPSWHMPRCRGPTREWCQSTPGRRDIRCAGTLPPGLRDGPGHGGRVPRTPSRGWRARDCACARNCAPQRVP